MCARGEGTQQGCYWYCKSDLGGVGVKLLGWWRRRCCAMPAMPTARGPPWDLSWWPSPPLPVPWGQRQSTESLPADTHVVGLAFIQRPEVGFCTGGNCNWAAMCPGERELMKKVLSVPDWGKRAADLSCSWSCLKVTLEGTTPLLWRRPPARWNASAPIFLFMPTAQSVGCIPDLVF